MPEGMVALPQYVTLPHDFYFRIPPDNQTHRPNGGKGVCQLSQQQALVATQAHLFYKRFFYSADPHPTGVFCELPGV